MKTEKRYKYWGITWESRPSYCEMGFWMCIVVLTFPMWVWGYFVYKFFVEIGKLNGKPKEYEVEVSEYRYY